MNKTFTEAILAAESISTRKEKYEALSGLEGESLELIRQTFNPFRVFGVKKWKAPALYAKTDPSFQIFFSLLDKLNFRELTGNAARDLVTTILGLYTEPTANLLERVIKKDLKCGASCDTFKKLYPALADIPSFEVMLASKIEESAETLTPEILSTKYGLQFPLLAEQKLDGNRLVAFVTNGQVQYLSRSGKPSDHLEGLFDEELAKLEKHAGEPIIVDGEVLANSFQETMNAKGSKNADAKRNLKFYAFDMMTRAKWNAQENSDTQLVRSEKLQFAIDSCDLKKVVKTLSKICSSIKELRDFYAEVLTLGINEDDTLNGLGEGLIVKNRHGLYEWDRSKNWQKWKPVITLDLKIVGFEFGNGRLANTIGKVLLEGYDENMKFIKAKCGSGLNDKMRDWLLKNQSTALNMTVEIEAQEITKAQNAEFYSARFPIWKLIRDDK